MRADVRVGGDADVNLWHVQILQQPVCLHATQRKRVVAHGSRAKQRLGDIFPASHDRHSVIAVPSNARDDKHQGLSCAAHPGCPPVAPAEHNSMCVRVCVAAGP